MTGYIITSTSWPPDAPHYGERAMQVRTLTHDEMEHEGYAWFDDAPGAVRAVINGETFDISALTWKSLCADARALSIEVQDARGKTPALAHNALLAYKARGRQGYVGLSLYTLRTERDYD